MEIMTLFYSCIFWNFYLIFFSFFSLFFFFKRTGWRGDLESWWRGLSDGQRTFAPICFLNVMVFIAWRVPALKTTMIRYFCANPGSRKCNK